MPSTVKTFVLAPQAVQAIQYLGPDNLMDLRGLIPALDLEVMVYIRTSQGIKTLLPGSYVVKGMTPPQDVDVLTEQEFREKFVEEGVRP